jgi:hypothetical protein
MLPTTCHSCRSRYYHASRIRSVSVSLKDRTPDIHRPGGVDLSFKPAQSCSGVWRNASCRSITEGWRFMYCSTIAYGAIHSIHSPCLRSNVMFEDCLGSRNDGRRIETKGRKRGEPDFFDVSKPCLFMSSASAYKMSPTRSLVRGLEGKKHENR